MKAYQAKPLPVPEYKSDNFYSDNPYEVQKFIARAEYQQELADENGHYDLVVLWEKEAQQAREWLRTHFTTV